MEEKLTKKEIACIKGCLKNNCKAQESFYKMFFGYGMSIALRYSKNGEEAEEILNDSFLKIFKKLDKYDFNKSLRGWIRKIIVNTAIDYFRQKNRIEQSSVSIDEAKEITYDYSLIDKLTAEQILMLLRTLPDRYRITFVLYEIEGYAHSEIAESLEIPVGTSRSNLTRSKQLLRKKVKALFEEKYERDFR